MKGDPEFIILKQSTWLNADEFESQILGGIIRYPLRPTDDYVSGLEYNQNPLISGFRKEFVLNSTSSASSNTSATLDSISSFNWKGSTSDSVHLTGKLLNYKRLQQHSAFWEKIKKDQNVANTVPGWISIFNSWQPCLVVGIMIAEDVELDFSGSKGRERDGNLQVPITTIATAAAGAPVPVGNVQVQAGTAQNVAGVFRAKSEKREIFALELRVVTSRWFKKELSLGAAGPRADAGRLAGEVEESAAAELKGVHIDDLTLDNFTEEDYQDMQSSC